VDAIVKMALKALCPLPGGAICVGFMLFTSNVEAQNLFETDEASGNIYEFTPGGVRSTFVSGLNFPSLLAFNSVGDLFVEVMSNPSKGIDNIIEITPSGVESTFASGLDLPTGLAFNSTGDLFVGLTGDGMAGSGSIIEITPNGTQSTFATGVSPNGIAFNGAGDLFEEDGSGNIYEFTPTGAKSTFASVPNVTLSGLAFDSMGNLYAEKFSSIAGLGSVYEFTPGGVRTTFLASGLTEPNDGPAFNGSGDLFIPNNGLSPNTGFITEIAPNGAATTFASGLDAPVGLAFQNESLPVPEPQFLGLLAAGTTMLIVCRRRNR
jgi:sugar lactone lactonase YvrE